MQLKWIKGTSKGEFALGARIESGQPKLVYYRGAPDPAGSDVSGSGSDPDPAGSEVGSGKYWPDLHDYDTKHHSILSFHQMTYDNTELYTKTH